MRPQQALPQGHLLLRVLRAPSVLGELSFADWDELVRLARQARLLGVLAIRAQAQPEVWPYIPAAVQGHLQSALHVAAYRAQMAHALCVDLQRRLVPQVTLVLLKGVAYLAQDLPLAQGRMIGDVDILVSPEQLASAETLLRQQGWLSAAGTRYDDHYYRAWSHELPPMRHPNYAVELDLHHAIAPPISRIHPPTAALLPRLMPLSDAGVYVLHPHDQILHAAIHLYQDTEWDGRLRDLVDIHSLLETFLRDAADWQALQQRARELGAETALQWALYYCCHWLGRAAPPGIPLQRPAAWLDWLMEQHCLPWLPEQRAPNGWLVMRLAQLRYQRSRMPTRLLLRHGGHKCVQAVTGLFRRRKTA